MKYNIRDILKNKDVEIAIQRPFYFRWLLQGSYYCAFLKVFLFFISIWTIGFFITQSENATIIKNGEVSLNYDSLKTQIIDTISFADNRVEFDLLPIDVHNIKYTLNFYNSNYGSKPYSRTGNLYLNKINLTEFLGSGTYLLYGRHLLFECHRINNKLELKFKVYGYGYLEDIPNYLFFAGLIIAIFLFRVLTDKFTYAFTGMERISYLDPFEWNQENGLLKILDFREDEIKNKGKIQSAISNISLKTPKLFWLNFLISALVIAFAFFLSTRPYAKTPDGNWNFTLDTFPISYYFNLIKDIFLFAIIIIPVLFRLLIIIGYTFTLSFNYDKNGYYKINPLSFDNAGGLSYLGEVTLFSFYMLISFFPHVYGAAYLLNFPVHLQIILPLYLLVTFLVFFLPLSSPHTSMQKAKNKMLKTISEQYNDFNDKYMVKLESHMDEDLSDLTVKMKDIKDLYTERKKMSVWPLDFDLFLKFGAVFVTNVFLYLSKYIFSFLKL